MIMPWLFIGDRFTLRDSQALNGNNIGRVLRLSNVETPQTMQDRIKAAGVSTYLRLPAEDVETDNLILHFDRVVEFVEEAREAYAKRKVNPDAACNALVRKPHVHSQSLPFSPFYHLSLYPPPPKSISLPSPPPTIFL